MENRTYFCIDMKSFFASVECAERQLDPLEAKLVVADVTRGNGAICLAVSPKMKSLGVKNRCRLFEIPKNMEYIIAKPQMKKYIEYAADIYDVYLDYISPDDIHVYSIDESFIDVTNYLKLYNTTAKDFAQKLMKEIAEKTHIPSTAGIGTNLFLAKIALDITAKKSPDRIGVLTEDIFCKTLWHHQPITDFWQIAKGTARKLANYGIFDMAGIATAPKPLLKTLFGKNYQILLDHAWGKESCTIADIKAYKAKSHSVSQSQILFEDYNREKAKLVLVEMTLTMCEEMMRRKVACNCVSIGVGYSKDVIPPTGAGRKIGQTTNLFSILKKTVEDLFEETTAFNTPIRKLSISFGNLVDEKYCNYDIFTDIDAVEKETRAEKTVLKIKDKFGKNAILRGIDLCDGATTKNRNKLIGGHNAE